MDNKRFCRRRYIPVSQLFLGRIYETNGIRKHPICVYVSTISKTMCAENHIFPYALLLKGTVRLLSETFSSSQVYLPLCKTVMAASSGLIIVEGVSGD